MRLSRCTRLTASPLRRGRCIAEPLESRTLFTLSVQFDYSLDSNHFFDDPNRRMVLQAAADAAVSHYADSLDAIVPSGTNTWKAVLDNPSSGGTVNLDNLTIPA